MFFLHCIYQRCVSKVIFGVHRERFMLEKKLNNLSLSAIGCSGEGGVSLVVSCVDISSFFNEKSHHILSSIFCCISQSSYAFNVPIMNVHPSLY